MPEPIPDLPAPIDSCLSALAASPPWQALVRCWSQSNPPLPATLVYLDVLNSPLHSELASRINPSLDSALIESALPNHHRHQHAPEDSIRRHNGIVNDAIRSLLVALPHALRANVVLRNLSSPSSLGSTAQAYQLRHVVWPTLAQSSTRALSLSHHHAHDSDVLDVSAMVAMDLHTWLRRSNGQFSQVFLALSQVYPGKLHPNSLAPCSRLYALVLYLSSSSSSASSTLTAEVPPQGLWNNPWATSGPDFLLARICAVIGVVMLPPAVDKQVDGTMHDSETADDLNEWECMMLVAAVVMTVVKHLQSLSSRIRRTHLLHVAVGLNGAVFTGASLTRMEQCLRIFFIGIVPWPTLILLIDYLLCCTSTSAEGIEELVSVMAQATNGDASQLGSLNPSPLLHSLPSISALHPSATSSLTSPPPVPDWLQPALATSSVSATDRKMLEDLADGVAFTQRRARVLVQRWQRTARAIARWCLFLDALRDRVRSSRMQQQRQAMQPAPTVSSVVAPSKQTTVPRAAVDSSTGAATAAADGKSDPSPVRATMSAAAAAHVQVLRSTLPSADLIKTRPLAALIELVVGQTLGGPSESLVMEMALDAARKRK